MTAREGPHAIIGGPLPTICAASPTTGLVALVSSAGLVMGDHVAPRGSANELELTAERVCIRAVHWGGRLAADATGHLAGDFGRGTTTTPVTCTLTAASLTRPTDR